MSHLVAFPPGVHSFYGALKIKVIYGTITIFGATVGKGFSDKIFSPFHQLAVPIQSDKQFCIQFTEVQENELHPNEIPYYDKCPDGFTQIIPYVYHSIGHKGPRYPNKLIKKINEIIISNKTTKILLYGGKGIGKSTLSNFLVNMLKSYPANKEINDTEDNVEEEEENENKQEEKPNENENKQEENPNEKDNDNDTEEKYYHFINDESELTTEDDNDQTFNRKVAFVDLDPGQPETSLPSTLSFTKDCPFLFGSSEHHSHFADERHCVSGVNLSSITSNFLFSTRMFSRVFDQNNLKSKDDPKFIVINSHGWIESDGFQLQLSIINSFNPDLVICLHKNTVPPPNKFTNNQFNVKIKPIREVMHLDPLNLRNIRYERYFMMKQPTIQSIPSFLYSPISSMKPICFPIKRFRYSFPYGINVLRCLSQIPRLLNCSIVSFCIDTSKYKEEEDKKYLFSLVSPKAMKCCGFGFIRAIDVQNQLIYIITPENEEELKQSNTISYLSSSVPNSFLRDSRRFSLTYHSLHLKPHLTVENK